MNKIVKILVVSFFLCGVVQNSSVHRQMLDLIESKENLKDMFKLWHYAIGRSYDLNSEVALQKYKVFKANMKFIKETNQKNLSYKLGLGPFTDLTWEEFKKDYLMITPELGGHNQISDDDSDEPLPKKINFDDIADDDSDEPLPKQNNDEDCDETDDWSYLYNGTVRNQGACGSCWAFAAIRALEGRCKQSNIDVDLSEQQLVDCEPRSFGCSGGHSFWAYDWIVKNGSASESSYPYTAGRGQREKRCRSGVQAEVTITGHVQKGNPYPRTKPNWSIWKKDVLPVLKDGPGVVYIEVKHGLEHYKQGDWLHPVCNQINHAVTAVHATNKYIKILNSWGQYWGEQGYGKIPLKWPGNLLACGAANFINQPQGCKKA